jgi:hypothetical protein
VFLEATYRGHAIRVIALGTGPFLWSYSLDGGECFLCEDAEFNTEDLALRDGHTAALLQIDRQSNPGSGDSAPGVRITDPTYEHRA